MHCSYFQVWIIEKKGQQKRSKERKRTGIVSIRFLLLVWWYGCCTFYSASKKVEITITQNRKNKSHRFIHPDRDVCLFIYLVQRTRSIWKIRYVYEFNWPLYGAPNRFYFPYAERSLGVLCSTLNISRLFLSYWTDVYYYVIWIWDFYNKMKRKERKKPREDFDGDEEKLVN